jgi:hypothetical protein
MSPLELVVKREALTKLKASNVWDYRYGLPTIPQHNNPLIYMAYVALLLKQLDERRAWAEQSPSLKFFLEHCEVDYGLLDRWPTGAGGSCSHDEIMGAGYLDSKLAARIVDRLHLESGRYDNKETDNSIRDQEYRFLFLVPFLRSCTLVNPDENDRRPVLIWHKVMWCLHVLHHAFTHKLGNESGTLKIWFMLDVMEQFVLCRWIGSFWQWRMKKHGLNGVKSVFKYYLNECPVLEEIAPERF